MMRLLLTIIAFLFISTGAHTQHYHFFYIQSDQQQPFYIKLGNEVQSSSAAGFLILPKLRDSAFDMIIGFPRQQFPEYRFRITQVKKDRGMSLKNFGEKGWGLFDLQTLEIQMGEKIIREEPRQSTKRQPITEDKFTAILATVIDDPGLMATELVRMEPLTNSMASNAVTVKETPVANQSQEKTTGKASQKTKEKKEIVIAPVKTAPKKREPIKTVPPIDSTAIAKNDVAKNVPSETVKVDSVKKTDIPVASPAVSVIARPDTVAEAKTNIPERDLPAFTPSVMKLSERVNDTAVELVFTDISTQGTTDTIKVLMDLQVVGQSGKDKVGTGSDSVQTESLPIKPDITEKPKISLADSTLKPDEALAEENITNTDSRKSARPACNKLSVEKDVTGLRRRMVALKDEDDMVAMALKDFKQKCFTSEQVRTISFVFVRDEGRYKLLDAAYPYVYDPENFVALEDLLTDPYFIHRFRALVKIPVQIP